MKAFRFYPKAIPEIYPFHTEAQYLKGVINNLREQYIFPAGTVSEHIFSYSDFAVQNNRLILYRCGFAYQFYTKLNNADSGFAKLW